MPAAQILYPCMQCADIFFLKADVCQLGLDQRKVNVLAREYCDAIKKKDKPIIISHHMMMGLKKGQEKMSKSDPDSAIFMEDSVEDVNRKVSKAYCEPQVVEGNPAFDYVKYLVFEKFGKIVVKTEKGEDKEYTVYDELIKDYKEGLVHPSKLKPAVADAINKMIEPVR